MDALPLGIAWVVAWVVAFVANKQDSNSIVPKKHPFLIKCSGNQKQLTRRKNVLCNALYSISYTTGQSKFLRNQKPK